MITISPMRGDWGTEVRLRILDQDSSVIDISSATGMVIYMAKPDAEVVNLSGSHYTDGTDGIMKATIQSGHFDEDGIYTFEPVATFATGEWGGTPLQVMVKPSLRTS